MQDFHSTQIDYVLNELSFLAKARPTLSPVDGVYQSDAIGEQLRIELLATSATLETKQPVDYHPGSKNMVVNLVHPSLYPFVAGVTRVVRDESLPWEDFIGGGHVVSLESRHAKRSSGASLSQRFQWLPAEVSIAADGSSCHFDSYINGLEPHLHEPLYRTLEKCFTAMLPLLGSVLHDLKVSDVLGTVSLSLIGKGAEPAAPTRPDARHVQLVS